jgi:hypothetical protein
MPFLQEAIQLSPCDPYGPAWPDPNEAEAPPLKESPNLREPQLQDYGDLIEGEQLVSRVLVVAWLGVAHLVPRHRHNLQ